MFLDILGVILISSIVQLLFSYFWAKIKRKREKENTESENKESIDFPPIHSVDISPAVNLSNNSANKFYIDSTYNNGEILYEAEGTIPRLEISSLYSSVTSERLRNLQRGTDLRNDYSHIDTREDGAYVLNTAGDGIDFVPSIREEINTIPDTNVFATGRNLLIDWSANVIAEGAGKNNIVLDSLDKVATPKEENLSSRRSFEMLDLEED
jgi:hypothetical protein